MTRVIRVMREGRRVEGGGWRVEDREYKCSVGNGEKAACVRKVHTQLSSLEYASQLAGMDGCGTNTSPHLTSALFRGNHLVHRLSFAPSLYLVPFPFPPLFFIFWFSFHAWVHVRTTPAGRAGWHGNKMERNLFFFLLLSYFSFCLGVGFGFFVA